MDVKNLWRKLRNLSFVLAILALFLSGLTHQANAQNNNPSYNSGRLKTVVITEAVVSTACMIGLHYLWYKKFPRSRFHLFNDNNEWRSMDKLGHATTAYNLSAIQYDMMRWSGVNKNTATWVGGLTALGLQTIIEIFDGFSSQWGFSKGDMLANISGAALFMGQQFAWGEQRASLRFSFHKTIYSKYHPNELGANKWQSWLKDYNGQTYWLSINPASFLSHNTSFPSYLNVAIGYGADGMIGARTNPIKVAGKEIPSFKRQSRWLLSLDADLKRFTQTNRPQTLLSIPGVMKMPAPALELRRDSALKFHWLYY
ncbi:MAG: hypothetical protein RLY16_1826 [Bacteroidota bacterium]|jgi:hypothetical protein